MNVIDDAAKHLDPMGHLDGLHLFIAFEVIGAIVGIVLMILIIRLSREFEGIVESAFNLLTLGLMLFVVSLVLAAWMDWSHIVNMAISMTIHMGLMSLALVIILIAAIRIIRRLR